MNTTLTAPKAYADLTRAELEKRLMHAEFTVMTQNIRLIDQELLLDALRTIDTLLGNHYEKDGHP